MNASYKRTWSRSLLLCAIAFVVALPTPAFANGVDLPKRSGHPGEVIDVIGHNWLGCCPSNTPVAHVRLSLLKDSRQILLFDTAPDDRGVIAASFTVPALPPGRYGLEACSEGLRGGDPNATPICLPEGKFRIVAASEIPRTGTLDLVPVALVLIVVGTLLITLSTHRHRVAAKASPR